MAVLHERRHSGDASLHHCKLYLKATIISTSKPRVHFAAPLQTQNRLISLVMLARGYIL
jgi:hypothetical protein